MRRAIATILAACVLAGAAPGQGQGKKGGPSPSAPSKEARRAGARQAAGELVRLRISSSPAPGTVVVDRGRTDGLAPGDEVTFTPRGGRRPRGRVTSVDERSAVVELLNPGVQLPPGTAGEVSIPAGRLATQPEPEAPSAPEPSEDAPDVPDDAKPAPPTKDPVEWDRKDDWKDGMPLLAKVGAVRPEERPLRITGRTYTLAEQIWTSDSARSTTTLRGGGALALENPFGRGGRLQADAEINYQDVDVPEGDGVSTGRLRVDRLSYASGGTRFEERRWEAGRFLQNGMPEFGVLDGFEYGVRRGEGHRLGGSVGFLPQPDNRYSTGDDFQISGHYRWVGDDSEQLAATAGYQKTWHGGNADRDLFVGRFHYLPTAGWNYDGTVWVDLYTDGDDQKPLLEVTQAFLRGGFRGRNGSGFDATYTHLAFPQIDRTEFRPVLDEQLANDHRERLALDSWFRPSRSTRLYAGLGGWADEDGEGFDLEGGIDVDDVLGDDNRMSFTAFGTKGDFSTVAGARVRYARYLPGGSWDAMLEYSRNNQNGFSNNNDDIYQTWLRLQREFWTRSGWNVSISADYLDWEVERNYSLGLYVQKSF